MLNTTEADIKCGLGLSSYLSFKDRNSNPTCFLYRFGLHLALRDVKTIFLESIGENKFKTIELSNTLIALSLSIFILTN